MTDRYTKVMKAIATQKTNDTADASIVLEHCMAIIDVLSNLRTEKVPELESEIFVAVCRTVGMNNITIGEYHPRKNGKAERFNSTFMLRSCHYVLWNEWNGDLFLLSLAYAYNVHLH